ncbi:YbaK/EbsC family protein [Thermocatellispora tengchongensis]
MAPYALTVCQMCGQVLLLVPTGPDPDPDLDPDDLPPRPARVLWPDAGRRPPSPAVPAHLSRELAEAAACLGAGAYTMALVNVRRLLEGVCADQGITGVPLYRALRAMRRRGLIEGRLADWAEELRELGNEAAHMSGRPVGREDAEDAIALAEALLDHLYVFRSRYEEFVKRRGGTVSGRVSRDAAKTGMVIRETPAMKTLRKSRVPFTPHRYEHDPARVRSRKDLAAEMGVPRDSVLKAVIAHVDGRPVVAVAPASAEIDVAALARACGGSGARLAGMAEVSRLGWATASEVMTPLALPYLPVVVDVAVTAQPGVYVSSGRHGLELEVAPADLITITGAVTAPITVRGGT